MSRVVRTSPPIGRRNKEGRVRRKSSPKTISARAGEKIRSFLGQHPTATDFYVRVRDGKITIVKKPAERKVKLVRVAPAGLFKELYTREYVAEENALAASSVIDLTGL